MILPYRKFFVLLQSQLEINRYIQSLKGKMAEWSIATVLKTVEGNTSGGSNPSLSAKKQLNAAFFFFNRLGSLPNFLAGVRIPLSPQ